MQTLFIKLLTIILMSKLIIINSEDSTKTNIKFILIWTNTDKDSFNEINRDPQNKIREPCKFYQNCEYPSPFNETYRELQNDPFLAQSCKYQNCYYTIDKSLLNSYTNYHAILFYGIDIDFYSDFTIFPKERNELQYYVDVMDESCVNFKMDRCYLNNFFNLTVTYKLDSDIPWPYFKVIDKTDNNTIVGPRINMTWKKSPKMLSKEYLSKLYGKTELAAWFVTHCETRNDRADFVDILKQEIWEKSGLNIDVFGGCGNLKCPTPELPNNDDCDQLLSDYYLFYLAFENSNTEDYVTEKVLRALQYDVVPVVYGGANYSRFLPPGSYINAKELGPTKTAIVMIYLYNNRKAYSKYFYWKNTYEYRDNILGFSCELCAILNSNRSEPRTHPRFTDWWNGRDSTNSSDPNIFCSYGPTTRRPGSFIS